MSTNDHEHRSYRTWVAAAGAVVLVTALASAATAALSLPLVCNQGPSGQRFKVAVDLPQTAPAGEAYEIRIDGTNSGKVSHFGLNYLHEMTTDYVLPESVSYVEGSAALVPGTGTPNVVASARVYHHAGVVTLRLPGHVVNDTDYTPPSITFRVRAVGQPGTSAVLGFDHFQLKANAFLVGDVAVACDPTPRPYPVGATQITAPAAAVPNR